MAKKNTTKNPDEAQEVPSGYLVLSPFRDRDNFDKAYDEGDDVSHFDEAILESLVNRGLVSAPKRTGKAKADPAPSEDSGGQRDGGAGDQSGDEGQ